MNFRRLLLYVILLSLVIAPRWASLKAFVTVDEPFWLSVGANFYYALGQREFQNTVYEYHPAVTTMWFVTGGFLIYFPEFRGFGQGYFDVDKDKFDPYLLDHGKSPLQLLFFSRLLQLLLITLIVLIIFHLLSLLVGDGYGLLITGFMASSPFFLGHSILLNHEALLAVCAVTSLLSLLVYLVYARKLPYLILSAFAAALAQLTKSSAIAFIPVIGLILCVSTIKKMRHVGFGDALIDHSKILGIWIAVLALVYVIIWPGMWVEPGRMLYEVYGNAFSYAFQGSRLQVTHELQPANFSLDAAGPVIRGFTSSLFARSTPLAWFGFSLAILSFFIRGESSPKPVLKWLQIYLIITAALFILMFGLAQGRNQLHYIMTSHVSLDLVAGLGWGIWIAWLASRWRTPGLEVIQFAWVTILLGMQLWSALAFGPYYYTYSNPIQTLLTGSRPSYGYGEGMELAADNMSAKPDAASKTVLAYHGRGPFSYFFPGRTLLLNPLWLEEPDMAPMVERLVQSDYLIFYDEFAGRSQRTAQFVHALDDIQPENVIPVQGLENIRIYRVTDLTPEFYKKLTP